MLRKKRKISKMDFDSISRSMKQSEEALQRWREEPDRSKLFNFIAIAIDAYTQKVSGRSDTLTKLMEEADRKGESVAKRIMNDPVFIKWVIKNFKIHIEVVNEKHGFYINDLEKNKKGFR